MSLALATLIVASINALPPTRDPHAAMSVCPYCTGKGCTECDGTGRRYRIAERHGDMTFTVTGSGGEPDPDTREALAELARAAFEKLRDGGSR